MLTLVLGGARSGKSGWAQALVSGREHVLFVATARPEGDPEMAARIERHRAERPRHFVTVEEPLDVVGRVKEALGDSVVLVDCATIWISNLLYEHRGLEREAREALLLGKVRALAGCAAVRDLVVVTNEVGFGLVPETPLEREFRDLQGWTNQILARSASRVVLMVAGIAVPIRKDQAGSSPPKK